MKITSEEVKALQSRIDVTYEDAEKLLIRCGGNMDKAVRMHEQKLDALPNKFSTEAKRIFKELLTYYIKITKNDDILMDLPLVIIVGFFLIMNVDLKVWIAVISIGIILISESTVSIYKKEKVDDSIIVKTTTEEKATEERRLKLVALIDQRDSKIEYIIKNSKPIVTKYMKLFLQLKKRDGGQDLDFQSLMKLK